MSSPSSPDRSEPEARLEELDAVLAALAHPARRQILLVVQFRGGVMSAGDIAGRFHHTWPTTSRHLKVLEEAGLLRHEKQGRTRLYRLDAAKLAVVKEWLGWFGAEKAADEEQAHGKRSGEG